MPRFIVTAEFDNSDEMNEWLNFQKETRDLSALPAETIELKPHVEPTGKEITEDKIRTLVSQCIGEGHRNSIATKIKEYGAESISGVPEANYQEFYDYLVGLNGL